MRSSPIKGPIGIFLIAILIAGHLYAAMIPEVFPQTPVGLAVTPAEQSTEAGGTVQYTVQVTYESIEQLSPTIQLSISPPEPGITVTFSPNNLEPPFTSTMTVQTSPSMSDGYFTLNIMADGARASVQLYVIHMITVPPPTEPPPVEPLPLPPPEDEEGEFPLYLIAIILGILAAAVIALVVKRRGLPHRRPRKRPSAKRARKARPKRPRKPTKYCIDCGKPLKPREAFCVSCGERSV